MEEPFELPVTYKEKELAFPARLLQYGYTHKFTIDIMGQEFLFEPDEERNYRAVIEPEQVETNKTMYVELLNAIAGAIEAIVK